MIKSYNKPCTIISMFDGVGMAAGHGIICDLRTSSSFSYPGRREKIGSLIQKLKPPVHFVSKEDI